MIISESDLMNLADQIVVRELMNRACPSIRARVSTDILSRSHDDPEVMRYQEEIYQDDLVQEVKKWQGAPPWITGNFHGSRGIETAVRILCEKGVRKDDSLLTSALDALKDNPSIIYRGFGTPGRILDDLGFGGSQLVDAVVHAQAGQDKHREEQINSALHAFRFAASVPSLQAVTTTMNKKTVFTTGVIWPSIYHLRLLAYTNSWRNSENLDDIKKGVMRLIELSPIPSISVQWRSRAIAPASFAMHDLNPDLSRLTGEGWMAWFHRTELLSRIGVIPLLPPVIDQMAQLNTILESGRGWFMQRIAHRSFYNWGAYTGLNLERDWRSAHRRIYDLTFRCLLIRKFASSPPLVCIFPGA